MTENEDYRRWVNRYIHALGPTNKRMRDLLAEAADAAYSEILALEKRESFSSGVKRAQLRMVMAIIQEILNDTFGKFGPIILEGNRDEARAAVSAFGEADSRILRAAISQTGIKYKDFIESQKRQAALSVGNAVSSLYSFDRPLSTRVYRTRFQATTWVRNQTTRDIALQRSAREIAANVKSSIRADVPGGVGYAAMRLARTELNNAFHATSIELAKDRPWVQGMRWNLSKTHKPDKKCGCQILANRVFQVDDTPAKPHPQCRCYVTPELPPMETFIDHLTSGLYQDWIENVA